MFLLIWTFLIYLAFSKTSLLSLLPGLVLAFWPFLFLLIRRMRIQKEVASHRPYKSEASHSPKPAFSSVHCVLNVHTTHQPANLFRYFLVKSNSAQRGFFIVLLSSILFLFIIVKMLWDVFLWIWLRWSFEFYTQICISDPLTLFFCFPFLLTLWTGQSLFPFWHPSAKPQR